jgi:hypothetical protein
MGEGAGAHAEEGSARLVVEVAARELGRASISDDDTTKATRSASD